MDLTPNAPVHTWRLRPRDGAPRAVIEHAAQSIWRWRIELALAYVVVTVTLLVLLSSGAL